MEMELKLLADAKGRRQVERHPAFLAVKPRKRKAKTTYFDTPDLALYRLGATLRVRRSDKSFIQTVKLDRPGGDLGARGEWEWPLDSASPDLGKLDSLPDEAASIREAAKRLEPLFTTIVKRKIWLLEVEDGGEIEAVLDRGTIQGGDKSLDISEVELELKQGAAAQVFRLAVELTERGGLRYGPRSKSQRGYELVRDTLPERAAAGPPVLEPGMPIGAAFPSLVNTALRELVDQVPDASAGLLEGIHQIRAAIRKLRTILTLFGPHLERRAARRFNAALRDLGATLGKGRDWDVFITETLPKGETGELGADAALLRGPAQAQREAAHATIADTLQAHALTGLILGLGAWTTDARWSRKMRPDARSIEVVPGLLDALGQKVAKRVRTLDIHDVEALHDLRKSMKKLRYSLEYVGSLFDATAVNETLRGIKQVLGVLGDINDAAVTELRVGEIAPDNKPELAPAAAALLRDSDKRRAKALGKLLKKLRALDKIKPPWG